MDQETLQEFTNVRIVVGTSTEDLMELIDKFIHHKTESAIAIASHTCPWIEM